MASYNDYIRGGEFLIAPSLSYKDQYILKCSECDEYCDGVESMFVHCIEHYKLNEDDYDDNCSMDEANNDAPDKQNGIKNSLKCEDYLESEGEDPLIEWDVVSETASVVVKEEQNSESNEVVEIEHFREEHVTQHEEECSDLMFHIESTASEPNPMEPKPGSFVREFMKSKLCVTSLIDAYREQPKLWNTNISNIKSQERNAILEEISKELKYRVNIDLTYAQVAAIIAHIRYTYRAKMRRLHTANDQSTGQTWYFEHLDFLKPFIDNLCMTTATTLQLPEHIQNYEPNVPPQYLSQLLDIYKRHPQLWNTDLAENCCENKRVEASVEMLNVIEDEMGLKINQDTLNEYLESIHKCVAQSKHHNIIKSKSNPSEAPESHKHMQFLYDHVGPFKCLECGRRQKNPLAFKIHKSQHDGSVAITCSICNKEFKMINTYIAHARRHMEDLKHECKECGKRFLNPYDLEIHMRCHTGVKPFCCELCGMSFRHIQTFASHKRKHSQNYLHKCPICSKGFYTKAKHDDHLRTHTNIREFKCNMCDKAFKTKKTLSQHVVVHDDVRKHACPLCGKTFKLKVGVNQHMKTHGSHIDKITPVD